VKNDPDRIHGNGRKILNIEEYDRNRQVLKVFDVQEDF